MKIDPRVPDVIEVVVEIPAGSRNKYEFDEHADAVLLIAEGTFPGCHVLARPVGGLQMRDEMGPEA